MKEEIYCIKCGTKNKKDNLLCKKCHRKLHQKEHLLIDYFVGKKEDEVGETILENIKKFIINHLYGIVMTCSILITSVAVITNISNRSDTSYIEKVTQKPVIVKTEEPIEKSEDEEFFNTALSYMDAIQAGNEKEARTYLLETNYPEIAKELKSIAESDTTYPSGVEHLLFTDGQMLVKMTAERDYYISKVPVAEKPSTYGNYSNRAYYVHMNYCSFDSCKVVDGKQQIDFTFPFYIEVVEVNGHYYVWRDYMTMASTSYTIPLDLFRAHNGDVSIINFEGLTTRYWKCTNNLEENHDKCLKEIAH